MKGCKTLTAPAPFTLVELLTVVSVIAVLIALLLPALTHARISTKRVVCANNLHQYSVIYGMYSGDYDDWLPYNNLAGNNSWDTYWLNTDSRDLLVRSYGLTQSISDCPSNLQWPKTTDNFLAGIPNFATWDDPYSALGISVVPTGYSLWSGRQTGWYNVVPPESIPLHSRITPKMLNGSTPTPWAGCFGIVRNQGGGNYYLFDWEKNPMHWQTGINSAESDGSVRFKRLAGITDSVDGAEDVVKVPGWIHNNRGIVY